VFLIRQRKNLGGGDIAPCILNFCTGWGWIVWLTPLPLYLREMSPRHQLCRRLGGPQSQSGRSYPWFLGSPSAQSSRLVGVWAISGTSKELLGSELFLNWYRWEGYIREIWKVRWMKIAFSLVIPWNVAQIRQYLGNRQSKFFRSVYSSPFSCAC
jgi:hypothetical protein